MDVTEAEVPTEQLEELFRDETASGVRRSLRITNGGVGGGNDLSGTGAMTGTLRISGHRPKNVCLFDTKRAQVGLSGRRGWRRVVSCCWEEGRVGGVAS